MSRTRHDALHRRCRRRWPPSTPPSTATAWSAAASRTTGTTRRAAAYDAHRARRDACAATVRGLGGSPAAAAAAYALPFPVPDGAAAVRLAAELEERRGGRVRRPRAGRAGRPRRDAAAALREAAVRAVRWRGSGVAFPGLAERAVAGRSVRPAASEPAGLALHRDGRRPRARRHRPRGRPAAHVPRPVPWTRRSGWCASLAQPGPARRSDAGGSTALPGLLAADCWSAGS